MSTGRKTRRTEGQYEKQPQRSTSLTRYDMVLTLIPLAFIVVALAAGVSGVSFHAALAGGSALSAAVLVDALFLNPPIDG